MFFPLLSFFILKLRVIFCYKLNRVSTNSCVKILILNVTVFGDRVLKEAIKIK